MILETKSTKITDRIHFYETVDKGDGKNAGSFYWFKDPNDEERYHHSIYAIYLMDYCYNVLKYISVRRLVHDHDNLTKLSCEVANYYRTDATKILNYIKTFNPKSLK